MMLKLFVQEKQDRADTEGGDMGSGVGERGFLGQVRAVQEATSEPPHTDSDQP